MQAESILCLLGTKAITDRRSSYETIINTTQSLGISVGADAW